jgi:hypothetical protein
MPLLRVVVFLEVAVGTVKGSVAEGGVAREEREGLAAEAVPKRRTGARCIFFLFFFVCVEKKKLPENFFLIFF